MKSRVLKERQIILKIEEDHPFIIIGNPNDLYLFEAYILGPKDSPFEEGVFKLKIELSENYPIDPTKMFFITKIFHPNIHLKSGEICVDFLKT